jgi:hypothetical protein
VRVRLDEGQKSDAHFYPLGMLPAFAQPARDSRRISSKKGGKASGTIGVSIADRNVSLHRSVA